MDENILLVIKEKPEPKKVRFSNENETKIIKDYEKIPNRRQKIFYRIKPKKKMGMFF